MQKPLLTLARFVGLPENRSAHLAIRDAAEQFGNKKAKRRPNNPLLLYGPPGTGKTHLTCALISEITRQHPDAITTHVAASELVKSGWDDEDAEQDAGDDMFAALTQSDLLVVENLQLLPAASINSFTVLIDEMLANAQQMVFTCNRTPKHLHNRQGRFPTRLVNRLIGGMVVAIESPGKDSRRILLQNFAGDLDLSNEVVTWLTANVSQGSRQLLGAVQQVRMMAETGETLDVETISAHFKVQAASSAITVEKIAKQVSGYYRVEPNQLVSKQRFQHLMVPRQMSMYLARQLTEMSLQQIGAYFGGRDHTTVMHACRKMEKALTKDASLSSALKQLQAGLQ